MADGIRLTHVGLCVSDLERSVAFYTEALGMRPAGELRVSGEPTATLLDVADLDLELVYLERDGFRLELLAFHRPGVESADPRPPFNQVGFTHLSLRVDGIDAVAGRVTAAGGTVLSDTLVTFAGGGRGILVLDPDGTRIELIERSS